MFGYLVNKLTVDSTFWFYVSVQIYQEVGGDVKLIKGKVFDKNLIKRLMDIETGSKVKFEVKIIERKTRKYTNIIDIEPADFLTCDQCFKPLEHEKYCSTCETDGSERLEGLFEVMDVSEEEYGRRFILRQNDTLVTYLMWSSLPFYQCSSDVKVGTRVNVIGWRTPNRITNLRKLSQITSRI